MLLALLALPALLLIALVTSWSRMRRQTRAFLGGFILLMLAGIAFAVGTYLSITWVSCGPPGCQPSLMRDVVGPIIWIGSIPLALAALVLIVAAFVLALGGGSEPHDAERAREADSPQHRSQRLVK